VSSRRIGLIAALLALALCSQARAVAIYPFPAPLSPAAPALLHHGSAEIALAARLRPHLLFDRTERWRPLAIPSFLQERFADGGAHHLWTERGYLEIHGSHGDGVDYYAPGTGACFDAKEARRYAGGAPPSRSRGPVRARTVNCDLGARSAMYYRRTTHAGLWYWDYWVFYRYNDYNGTFNRCLFYCDDHEGDWEGVTIVTTRDLLAPQVVGALYAEHENRIAVARPALLLDPSGQHVSVFVANGSHASYRFACPGSCEQHVVRPEERHDGASPWEGNDDAVCVHTQCVQPLPESGPDDDGAAPSPSAWSAQTAKWGSTCPEGCTLAGPSPDSPGRQGRYRCPWVATRVDQGLIPAVESTRRLPAPAVAPVRVDPCPKAPLTPATTIPGLVALGDSYSSGEGAGNYDPETIRDGNSCHRSADAWPLQLATRLKLDGLSLACSGAETPEVLRSGVRKGKERDVSQISRIGPPPEIITITIGGNDIGFADVLGHCVGVKIGEKDCVERYALPGHDLIQDDIDDLERELPGLYRAIQQAAPGSRLVVVGYPRIFPPASAGPHTPNCAAWSRISDHEAQYLNDRGHALDEAIQRAAAAAKVEYVDVEDAFDDHELRCKGASYVNRLELRLGWPPYRHESFHPNALGQARLADLVARALAT
jgi:lysophospholipase L1-like esterase